ncbi:MAG: hypothetical protein HUJ90_01610, partial [Bacteroidales bacterium]|nr:hypothetical protein [Bacteroidales bacterium]
MGSGAKRSLYVLFFDTVTSVTASLLAILFLRFLLTPIFGFQTFLFAAMGCSGICSILSFLILGTHKIVVRHSTIRSLGRLAWASLLKVVMMLMLLY